MSVWRTELDSFRKAPVRTERKMPVGSGRSANQGQPQQANVLLMQLPFGQLTSLAETPAGELWFCLMNGSVRALRRVAQGEHVALPERLSDTGLFTDLATLTGARLQFAIAEDDASEFRPLHDAEFVSDRIDKIHLAVHGGAGTPSAVIWKRFQVRADRASVREPAGP
jgi:hypothetical protein